MKNWILILSTLTFPIAALADGTPTGSDLAAFKRNAELCEHFAGEWDSMLPLRDRRAIERGVDKYCALAQKQQIKLKKKYHDDEAALKVLDQYESVTSFSK